MEKITRFAAIKRFFESDGGRKVTMEEMKQLEERGELAGLAAQELGVELIAG